MDTKMRFEELYKNYQSILDLPINCKSHQEFIEKQWTIADIDYQGEHIIVKPTDDFKANTGLYIEGITTWLVIGEVAQMPGHFTVLQYSRGAPQAFAVPFFLHGSDLLIVMEV